ncbi:hypothetical protein ACFRCW_24245 [Streptomyces sp. NPDC056653]|uniref:hypothetical protein n=1 Tax=unclassified Streptomyces TaxID=2593676 RepID=UPI00339DDFB1
MVFRFGKALPGHRQPGITFLVPFADRMRKVNVQVVTLPLPTQEGERQFPFLSVDIHYSQ